MAKKRVRKKASKKKASKKTAATRRPARKAKRPIAKKKPNAGIERELEEGLRETFPGSDPLAQTDPTRSIKE